MWLHEKAPLSPAARPLHRPEVVPLFFPTDLRQDRLGRRSHLKGNLYHAASFLEAAEKGLFPSDGTTQWDVF